MEPHYFLCDSFYPSFGADLLIAFLGAGLGLAAAYYVYMLSVWRTREDRLKYVASLIEKIVPSALRQSQYCSEYADTISTRPFENHNLRLEANRDPKRLSDKVDQEGVYHAYLWKYGRDETAYKSFRNLYGYIDYIDYLVDDLIKINERVLISTWERKKRYKVIYGKLREGMQSLVLIPEIKDNQPELIDYARSLLEKFDVNQTGSENLTESYQQVVTPMQEFIRDKAKQHPKVTELLFLTQDLSDEYIGIDLSAKHNAIDYRDFATSFKKAADNLLDSSKQLRKDFNE